MKQLLKIPQWLFELLISLKLAVVIIVALAAACALATILESIYDTPTAQYWVYRSWWFYGILAVLGAQIFAVAMSRIPWKKKHTPFLLAHLGILILLFGSWLTERYGIDGILRVEEGEIGTVVEIQEPTLILVEGNQVKSIPVPWRPPNAEFSPIRIDEYGIEIDRYLSHAQPDVRFHPAQKQNGAGAETLPAVKVELKAGDNAPRAMRRFKQEFWLWSGDPAWMSFSAGPARVSLASAESKLSLKDLAGEKQGPSILLKPASNGALLYETQNSAGKTKRGRFSSGKIDGAKIHPGWAVDFTLTVKEWIPDARSEVRYRKSDLQYGLEAPPSAIHLKAGDEKDARLWLGLGDRATLQFRGREIAIGYYPRRVLLPFGIQLQRFEIEHYQGTTQPAEYSSRVRVVDDRKVEKKQRDLAGQEILVSMNEPLYYGGFTFYQSSYEPGEPRATVSIFSVNQDPGRWWKYIGSILIVLGAILLFAMRKFQNRKKRKPA